jgi:hypothetical protein
MNFSLSTFKERISSRKGIKISYLFLFLFSILVLLFFYFNSSKNKVNFQSSSKIIKLLSNDEDQFFRNFTELDLKARKYSNFQDYLNKIKRSFVDIKDDIKNDIKNKIIKLTNKADQLLLNKYPDISKLDWNIILFNGREYEDGSPHVRFGTIFLPLEIINRYSDNHLVNTLIHEKIHLFQKKNPNHPYIQNFLKDYTRYKPRKEMQKENRKIRSNPDLDEWIYKDKINNIVLYQEFRENPTTLYDCIQSGKDEHPYERMAYLISESLTQ